MSFQQADSPKLFFNPLRSRFLWLTTGAHLLVAVALGQIFFFAPDEGGYLQIFKHTYISSFSTSSVLGWSNSQTYFLRIVYAPAKILSSLGVPDYLSIRVLAIFTSMVAIYLLMCIYQFESHTGFPLLAQFFFFTPSLFLWMTLGLRESFIYLSLSMICFGIFGMHRAMLPMGFTFLVFGNLILFETKSYLFLLVACASFVYLGFEFIKSKKVGVAQVLVAAAVVLPVLLNPTGDSYLIASIKGTFTAVSSTGQVGLATVSDAQAHVASENAATTTSGLCQSISSHPEGKLSKTFKFLGFSKNCSSKVSGSGSGASGYRTSRLNVEPARFGDPLSIAYRTSGFLFTPFPFIDNGSLFLNVAALESPFWWFLYIAFGVVIWRRVRYKAFDAVLVFIFSFSILFTLFSAFTEINVGTLARHRSVLVFPLFYFMAYGFRKTKRNDEILEASV